jgi:hypothetical protein
MFPDRVSQERSPKGILGWKREEGRLAKRKCGVDLTREEERDNDERRR